MTRLEAEIDPKSTAVDLVTFDLTWFHLTVACELSRLQTTSQVQKLFLDSLYLFCLWVIIKKC